MKNDENIAPSYAPALLRGLRLLENLQKNGPESLENLAASENIAKSSAKRLLETLVEAGYADRDPESKQFRAIVQTVKAVSRMDFEQALRNELQRLCDETGQAAEWWQIGATGMVLVHRHAPLDRELLVYAKPGFVFPRAKLETIPILEMAFFHNQELDKVKHCLWDESAKLIPAPQKNIKAMLNTAKKQGWFTDGMPNGNGVRRIAIILGPQENPSGIIALAVPPYPAINSLEENFLPQLQQISENLNRYL